jgi:C-terminal processing protease CtpA/Prc
MDEVGGIGVVWDTEPSNPQRFVVVKLVANGPAHESGMIHIGDTLLSVDGIIPTDLDHVRRAIMGRVGTIVSLLMRSTTTGSHLKIQLQRRRLYTSDGRVSIQSSSPPSVSGLSSYSSSSQRISASYPSAVSYRPPSSPNTVITSTAALSGRLATSRDFG